MGSIKALPIDGVNKLLPKDKMDSHDKSHSPAYTCTYPYRWKENTGRDLKDYVTSAEGILRETHHHSECPGSKDNFENGCQEKEEDILSCGCRTTSRVNQTDEGKGFPNLLAQAMVVSLSWVAFLEEICHKL